MLETNIDNISEFLRISNTLIPNIITIVIVAFLLILTLKSQLSWITIGFVYVLCMGILTILGIDSVFNVVTLIGELI